MIGDGDIWRCAAIMIRQHGRAADLEANARAARLLDEGDRSGQQIWLRVAKAIHDLMSVRPRETMH